MDSPPTLNLKARRVAETLIGAFPERRFAIEAVDGGHLEASLEAPSGSRAGALVVLIARDGDIWIRFALPHAFYAVDDECELIRVVGALLGDDAFLAVTYEGNDWTGTTLIPRGKLPRVERNQRAVMLSWSGKQDADTG